MLLCWPLFVKGSGDLLQKPFFANKRTTADSKRECLLFDNKRTTADSKREYSFCQQKNHCRQQTWISRNKQEQYKMNPNKLKKIKEDLVVKGEDYPLKTCIMEWFIVMKGLMGWGLAGNVFRMWPRIWSFSSSSLFWPGVPVFSGWKGGSWSKMVFLVRRSCRIKKSCPDDIAPSLFYSGLLQPMGFTVRTWSSLLALG